MKTLIESSKNFKELDYDASLGGINEAGKKCKIRVNEDEQAN